MYAPQENNIVRLEGTVESAIEIRECLLRIRDILPEDSIDRDIIVGLAVQLRYAITNARIEVV